MPTAPDYNFTTTEVAQTGFVEQETIDLASQPTHVITVLHGIRDPGIWALNLQYISRSKGLNILPMPVSYGWLGAIPFLFRIGARSIEKRVQQEFKEIYDKYPAAMHSIIAHSNGTKLVAMVLSNLHLKYNNVIFFGSVCRKEDLFTIKNAKTIVNDCSPIDIWPLMAQSFNPWHYEATGTYGFRYSVKVEDRFFTASHGGLLTEKHFIEFVVPIISSNLLKFGEKPKSVIPYGMPNYLRIFLLAAAAFLVWAYF